MLRVADVHARGRHSGRCGYRRGHRRDYWRRGRRTTGRRCYRRRSGRSRRLRGRQRDAESGERQPADPDTGPAAATGIGTTASADSAIEVTAGNRIARLTYKHWKMEVLIMRKSIGIIMSLALAGTLVLAGCTGQDRKSTRLNSSHLGISYAVFCLK